MKNETQNLKRKALHQLKEDIFFEEEDIKIEEGLEPQKKHKNGELYLEIESGFKKANPMRQSSHREIIKGRQKLESPALGGFQDRSQNDSDENIEEDGFTEDIFSEEGDESEEEDIKTEEDENEEEEEKTGNLAPKNLTLEEQPESREQLMISWRKEARNNKLREKYKNLTPEEKEASNLKQKKTYAALSDEVRKARNNKLREKYKNLTPEEKEARNLAQKQTRANETTEKKEARNNKLREKYKNLTPEEKEARNSKLRDVYAKMTTDQEKGVETNKKRRGRRNLKNFIAGPTQTRRRHDTTLEKKEDKNEKEDIKIEEGLEPEALKKIQKLNVKNYYIEKKSTTGETGFMAATTKEQSRQKTKANEKQKQIRANLTLAQKNITPLSQLQKPNHVNLSNAENIFHSD